MRASFSESWMVAIVLGELSMGSPRRRMAAMSEAAISKAPFCRSSAVSSAPDMAGYSSVFAFCSPSKTRTILRRLGCRAARRPSFADLGKGRHRVRALRPWHRADIERTSKEVEYD